MIIVKLKNGLGNQLFQYAFGRLFQITNHETVKYEFETYKKDTAREYKLDKFNTEVVFATPEEIKKFKGNSLIRRLRTKLMGNYYIGYSPTLLSSKEKYFEGYFQSYKYLEPIRNELLREITLKNPIDQKFPGIIEKMRGTNSVSVHIRRGDYVSDEKIRAAHYTFGLEYYEAAFNILKTKVGNPSLFVFSDDIEWVKENLKTDIPMQFVSEPNMPDYENFMIATYCKHNIIANSSFSFWIAWLNQNPEKVVIAPKKWNNVFQKEYEDLLPKEWIQI